jgi:hypothetical protein
MNGPSETVPARIGRYEVLRELGRGAMGVVFAAHDPLLGREVALKTIRLGFTVSAEERARFEQRFFSEARAAARLQHPSIVVVHDVGQDETSGDLFIALEYLRGQTLAERVDTGGPLPWPEALAVVQRLARALHHAHGNGIVHRDVKPDNVMLLESGEPKLMDFGIARVETAQLTVAGQVFGTPRYMSPEQALGQPTDARSDIFALGSVAYYLLTGAHAFGAPTIPLVINQVVQHDPSPPSTLAPSVPPAVEAVVSHMLAKRPDDRYPTAQAVAEDIEDVLAHRPPRHAPGRDWAAEDAGSPLLALLEEPSAEATRVAGAGAVAHAPAPARGPRPWMVGTVLGVGVLVAAAWALRGTDPADSPDGPVKVATRPAEATSPAPQASPPEPSPLAEGYARVRFKLDHSLRRGQLEISVDGDVVYESDLEGRTTRKLRVIKTSRGRLEADVDVPAGERTIRVEVSWDDERKARSVRTTLEPGETRQLSAELGGLLRKNLSLALD